MESNKMRTPMNVIKKIPLENFISLLVELYDKGVNYIDLSGRKMDNQDIIEIGVLEEYLQTPIQSFKEEDFNKLIG